MAVSQTRLVPPPEAREVKNGLADGSVQVVIGTHALVGRDVRFADGGDVPPATSITDSGLTFPAPTPC